MKVNELHDQPVKPDTYEAGMALNQLLKIGTHAIKIHNMIDDNAEMEAWVAKKIDLASNYVKSVHGYTAGSKAGTYDDDGMSESREQIGDYAREIKSGRIVRIVDYTDDDEGIYTISYGDNKGENDVTAKDLKFLDQTGGDQEEIGKFDEDDKQQASDKEVKMAKGVAFDKRYKDGNYSGAYKTINKIKPGLSDHPDVADALRRANEDAGEGHMSKSQLYQTAKMSIELLDMIKKGDDLEGWVQTKLNLAADYLQAVYHYEDYQKLNPYREEIDGELMQKHAGVIQKNLDEILARETKTADVDTKPGMMRILKKRVNEVEKEIAKENRKETNEEATIKPYISMYKGKDGKQVYDVLDKYEKSAYKTSDERLARAYFKKNFDKLRESGILYKAGVKKYGKAGMTAIQSAAGKGANHEELGKIKDKHLKDDEALGEGIKEWGQRLAMAGVIVAGLAGVNSISNAIDNSVPAISAMNTALDMAQDSGNTELAKMIEKDLSDAKVRLSSGKDLGAVADMQEKYAKFMKTEGLAYESKLVVSLNKQLK